VRVSRRLLVRFGFARNYCIGKGRDIGVPNLRAGTVLDLGLGLEQFQSNRRFRRRQLDSALISKRRESFAVKMMTVSGPALVRRALYGAGSRCIYRTCQPAIQKRFQTIQSGECRLDSSSYYLSSTDPVFEAPATTPPIDKPSDSTPPPPPPPRSRTSRVVGATALFIVATAAGLAMSVAPAIETANGFISPPTNAETLTLWTPASPEAEEINNRIVSNPLSESLRANPQWTESRPHMKIPENMRSHNLTAGTLQGQDKIASPPLTFANTKAELPSIVQITHLGQQLCGHPTIIHGGLLATLLDEGLARACFPALPNKVGVTASLNITYKKPCPANSYVVLRAETTKVDGRKAWVKGWIELLGDGVEEGEHLVEAEALFIEPRGAKNMARLYSNDD
jgi:acyl-coenzyme A thioesterase PaaI-like protein